MARAIDIYKYLQELSDKNEMKALLKVKNMQADVLIDLNSGNYNGVRMTIDVDNETFEIDTKYSWIFNQDNTNDWIYFDKSIRLALDRLIVKSFDYDDIDEDYFNQLSDDFDENLKNSYYKQSKKLSKRIINSLKAIMEAEYDKEMIRNFVKQFKKIKKQDGYNLKLNMDSCSIKLNTKKNILKVKDNYGFEKIININEEITGFNIQKLVEYIDIRLHRKDYNERMMELEDRILNEKSIYSSYEASPDSNEEMIEEREETSKSYLVKGENKDIVDSIEEENFNDKN